MKHKRLLSILLALVLVLSVLPVLPVFAAEYNLTVAGVQVTDANKASLAGGAMSYNSGTKTLTVKGDYSYSDGVLIENGIDGLIITSSGTDTYSLTTYGNDVIVSNGAALNVKDAKLSMISYGGSADRSVVYMSGDKALTFENADVYMNGGWTLCGVSGALNVKESYLTIAAGERAVNGFSGITLTDCSLVRPAGGKYTTGAIFESDGATYAKNVTIARTYALKIAGTQVTDANKHDILGDGAFELDTDSYSIPALLIKKDCNAGANHVIDSELDYLTITVDDRDVTLTAESGSGKVGIRSTGTVLLGSNNNRKLTIDAPTGIYIKASASRNLLIGEMSLEVKNSVWGITGTADKVGLSFYDAEVTVTANNEAVSDFKSIDFTECELLEPVGGTYDTGTILNSNGTKAKTVRIGDQPAPETYNIMVCGKTVTSENQNDVLGDGSVSFQKNGSSYYLYLNKDISWSNGSSMAAIHSTLGDYLYVIVTDDVTINRTTNGGGIYHNNLLYISGSGADGSKLTVTGLSSADGAIYAAGELDIYNANVDATGGQYAIHAGGKLEIKNSIVAAKSGYSAVYGDGGLSLIGNVDVILPTGGQIFGSDIRKADGSRATEVLLGPVENYDLKVCGKQVTSANATDILGDGVFEYLPEEKLIVVRGNCEHHDSPIIESSIEGLGISVMADSVLTAVDASAIILHKDAAIGGTGKLTVSGVNAIYADGCKLMLYKAKISATGSQYGIRGASSATLVVESNSRAALQKTDLYAKGGTAAIGGFAGITLSGCYIKTPEDGEVKNGAIVDANSTVAREVQIVQGTKPVTELVNPFTDVKESDYWYNAVLWAYYHTPQITTGTSATKFSPNNTCTRAQIVTFLWRAKGCPEPTTTESPFKDVKDPGQYYYKAVLWAVENGVTTGTSPTAFSPDRGCTRAQVVTFQWRANGKPAPSTTDNPFKDVKSDQYYYDAVLWAVGKGVTTGTTPTTFSPDKTCTRGQIVTFLWRDLA